jgi:hypothetical protein
MTALPHTSYAANSSRISPNVIIVSPAVRIVLRMRCSVSMMRRCRRIGKVESLRRLGSSPNTTVWSIAVGKYLGPPVGTAGMTWVESSSFPVGLGVGSAGTAGMTSVGVAGADGRSASSRAGATGAASAITGLSGSGSAGGARCALETYTPGAGGSSAAVSLFCEPDV